jgi:hypothetical protein
MIIDSNRRTVLITATAAAAATPLELKARTINRARTFLKRHQTA